MLILLIFVHSPDATNDVIDVIDFGQREDGILGAGFDAEGTVMLFTFRDALVSLVPNNRENLR